MTNSFRPFTRITLVVLALAGLAFGQPAAAPSSAPLSFEVASIKPSGPLDPAAIMSGKAHVGITVDKARVDVGSANLMGLICWAYKIKPFQVSGQPEWLTAGLNADRFDILAKMPDGATEGQAQEMMQTLLSERFQLRLHHENKDVPVFALVVGKAGPKFQEAAPDPPPPAPSGDSGGPGDSASAKPATAKGEVAFGSGDNRVTMKPTGSGMAINSKESGPVRMTQGENGAFRMEADKMTMEMLASMLSQYVGRPVVDLTELKGKYKVSLELSMDTLLAAARAMGMNPGTQMPAANPTRPAEAASDPSGALIFESVQRLGLKLDSRKLPYDTLVIDHIEKTPTEN